MTEKINIRFLTLSLLVLLAACSRLLPHPPNFTPIAAMSLFGAAYFGKKYFAFLIPVLGLWFSDILLNNTLYAAYFDGFSWGSSFFVWNVIAIVAILGVGSLIIKKVNVTSVIGASLSASVVFFLISNFGVWASGTMYPLNVGGLLGCYMAGIPFFLNTIIGDLFYCTALFGTFELVKSQWGVLALSR